MSKILVALTVVAAATGTLASRLIWTLLTDPASMALALGSGSLKALIAALLAVQHSEPATASIRAAERLRKLGFRVPVSATIGSGT